MKQKGFTLIELLAVIVILAIIAVIATPMVLNTIDDARKGAAKSSATTYMSAVEEYVVKAQLDTSKPRLQAGVKYLVDDIKEFIELKGDKPTSGYVVISEAGTVQELNVIINDYSIICSEKECNVSTEESLSQSDYEAIATYLIDEVEKYLASDSTATTYTKIYGEYHAGYTYGDGTEQTKAFMSVYKCTENGCLDDESSQIKIDELKAIPYMYSFTHENGKVQNGEIIFDHYPAYENATPAPIVFVSDGQISGFEMNFTG